MAGRPPKRDPDEITEVRSRIPVTLNDELTALAKAEYRSVSAQIHLIIEEYVEARRDRELAA